MSEPMEREGSELPMEHGGEEGRWSAKVASGGDGRWARVGWRLSRPWERGEDG